MFQNSLKVKKLNKKQSSLIFIKKNLFDNEIKSSNKSF